MDAYISNYNPELSSWFWLSNVIFMRLPSIPWHEIIKRSYPPLPEIRSWRRSDNHPPSDNLHRQKMAYPIDEKQNLEAGTIVYTYPRLRQHRRTKLLIAFIGGTIALYSLFGAIILCFYTDATLLALITNPSFNHRLNHLRNQWIGTKSDIEKLRDVNVVAVVEYRNWERSSILDCYLQVRFLTMSGAEEANIV